MKGIDDFIISFYHLIACWMQGLRLLIVSCPPPPPTPHAFWKGGNEVSKQLGNGGGRGGWLLRNEKCENLKWGGEENGKIISG